MTNPLLTPQPMSPTEIADLVERTRLADRCVEIAVPNAAKARKAYMANVRKRRAP